MSGSGVEGIVSDYFARLRRALAPLPRSRRNTVVHGVSFFIGTLPRSACAYPSLELNAAARDGSSQHNLGFGRCVTGKLVEITCSQGAWSVGR